MADDKKDNLENEYLKDIKFEDQLEKNNEEKVEVEKEDVKQEAEKLNTEYLEYLEKVMFYDRLNKEREKKIQEEIAERTAIIKQQQKNPLKRKKTLKEMEKSIYEDYYSVEKDFSNNYEKLQAEQEEELNKIKKNLKGYKENGLLKLYDEQKERQKELERKLSEGLDFAVKETYFENDTYNKMKDKFPEISKQLETDFKMNANQQDIKEDNLRRYDGIIKTYNKEYPEVKQELGSFGKLKQWSKENKKAIETGQKILSGAALVINPVTAVAVRGVMAIMKTKPMKEFSKSLSNNVSNGLDKLGIKKDSKLRTGLRLAKTAVVMGGIVGVGLLTADANPELLDALAVEGENFNETLSELKGDLSNSAEDFANKAEDFVDGITASETAPLVEEEIVAETNTVETEVEATPQEATPQEITMKTVTVQAGDTMGAIIETIDSADFDLQGSKLYAVADLIAEMNGIENENIIFQGAELQIPANTEELKAFVEQNSDKLDIIMETKMQAAMEVQEFNSLATAATATAEIPEIMQSYSSQIANIATHSVISPEMADSLMEQHDLSEKDMQEMYENIEENIEKQMQDGIFPRDILLDFEGDNDITISKEVLEAVYNDAVPMALASEINELERTLLTVNETKDSLFSTESYSNDIANNIMESGEDTIEASLEGFRNPEEVKADIQKSIQENIAKQIENNTFPRTIELTLNDGNGKVHSEISISKSELQGMYDMSTVTQEGLEKSYEEKITEITGNIEIKESAHQMVSNKNIELPNQQVEQTPENNKPKGKMKLG